MNESPKAGEAADVAVAIVGAGPQGLAAALHILDADPGLHRDLVVLDPAGGWLRAWDERCAQLGIEHLRSPAVHHPGCDPHDLAAWAQRHGLSSGLPYGLPSTVAFRRFCAHLVTEAGMGEHVAPTRLRDIAAGAGAARLTLSDGSTLVAAQVVVATDPARRRLPPWSFDLLPVPPDAVAHADDVDLRRLDLAGQHVAVVGGGLTAGHLAVGAVARGASVSLVSRRPLREQMFDTDAGWLGPKHLDGFHRIADPAHRSQVVLAARDGGSLPPWMTRRLDELRAAGSLRLHAARRVCGAQRSGDRIRLVLGDESRLEVDRVWLATGTRPDVRADRITAALLATHPTGIVEGCPMLDGSLRWPGTNVHILGRLARLAIGPAAGNLWGARVGARRVAGRTTWPVAEMVG